MGCCLFSCVGAVWPRLTLIFLWLFTPITIKAFHSRLWPILGFFLLPTTTLVYAMIRGFYGVGVDSSIWTLGAMFLAFVHDLGQLGMFKGARDDEKSPV